MFGLRPILFFLAGATILLFFTRCSDEERKGNTSLPIKTSKSNDEPKIDFSKLNFSEFKVYDSIGGNGPAVTGGSRVFVNYDVYLPSGQKIDSSKERGGPADFLIGGNYVIPCWDRGIIGMKVGGRRWLVCPSDLAYGSQGWGYKIPPNTPLTFDITLLNLL